jgi:hypothetical protein
MNRSCGNQKKKSARKKVLRERRMEADMQEAARRGMTVMQLHQEQQKEAQIICAKRSYLLQDFSSSYGGYSRYNW